MDPSKSIHDDGHPSDEAKKANPRMIYTWPIDFFHLMIKPRFVEKVMVTCTNQKAAAEGARVGGTFYKDFVPFKVDEMYHFIDFYLQTDLHQSRILPSGSRAPPLINCWVAISSHHS
jgi:hypothetical protein